MGKGLGWLQREILNSLDEAKLAAKYYSGAGYYGGKGPGWVKARRLDVLLQNDVYDLRCSERHLAKKHGKFSHATYISSSFQASFSRAAAGLIERGLLEKITGLVPIQEPEEKPAVDDYNSPVQHLADGWYLMYWGKQARFVKFINVMDSG